MLTGKDIDNMEKINNLGAPMLVNNIIRNLTSDELRSLAKKDEVLTEYGSPSYISKIKSRSAKFTEIIYDQSNEAQAKIIKDVQDFLKTKTLICVDRQMCQSPDIKIHCQTYVTNDFARIAYMWGETLFPWNGSANKAPRCSDTGRSVSAPMLTNGASRTKHRDEGIGAADSMVIDVPEWPERKVLVLPKLQLTYVLGTDYFGEIKKANLRMGMYLAKKKGWLGLHAASKLIRVKDVNDKMVEKGVIIFGLSGTGKTSLSCHHHGLTQPEGIIIRQDDVIFMRSDARCYGTENNFYLKTEGLSIKDQPLLYKGATSPNAILENVYISPEGKVDFFNDTITSNGRAIVRRTELTLYTDNDINLPRADVVIFLTRRVDIVPPVAKLTPEQGAAFFMLGESIETSAGDPTQAGKSLRVVGTNPFIIGPAEEEGNWFHKMLEANPRVECFVMNTGRVGGPNGEKIKVLDSSEIIKQIVRGGIKWKIDPDWNYQVPSQIEGVNVERFDPLRFYSQNEYRELIKNLRTERKEYLAKFPGLVPQIKNVIKEN
jgi:phosphoenolpyruvate carboxykinase (ATP)